MIRAVEVAGAAGACLSVGLCWAALVWLCCFAWWLLREGRSTAAMRGMRYSTLAAIVAGSGAVVCLIVVGVDRAVVALVEASR